MPRETVAFLTNVACRSCARPSAASAKLTHEASRRTVCWTAACRASLRQQVERIPGAHQTRMARLLPAVLVAPLLQIPPAGAAAAGCCKGAATTAKDASPARMCDGTLRCGCGWPLRPFQACATWDARHGGGGRLQQIWECKLNVRWAGMSTCASACASDTGPLDLLVWGGSCCATSEPCIALSV